MVERRFASDRSSALSSIKVTILCECLPPSRFALAANAPSETKSINASLVAWNAFRAWSLPLISTTAPVKSECDIPALLSISRWSAARSEIGLDVKRGPVVVKSSPAKYFLLQRSCAADARVSFWKISRSAAFALFCRGHFGYLATVE